MSTSRPESFATRSGRPDICIVLNLGSGRRGDDAETRTCAAMNRHSGRFALRTVRKRDDPVAIARRAAEEGFATLVAAGGDGTIGAVAEVVRAHELTLGVVPMGTFNFFARGLGLPENLDAAVDLVARGPTRRIGLGEVNGRLSLNNEGTSGGATRKMAPGSSPCTA